MTSTNHTIIPPLPLLVKWKRQYLELGKSLDELLLEAARWGADTELEACCTHAVDDPCCGTKHQRRMLVRKLKERRRPAPPTLKQQALSTLRSLKRSPHIEELYGDDLDVLKEAIAALPD